MITLGLAIKEARLKKKLSRKRLEDITKIKESFIEAIEEEKWDKLPEAPVVVGFLKNLSSVLDLSLRQVAALYRRDYPQKKLKINPNPDLPSKFSWTPKATFVVSMLGVFILIGVYLSYQYYSFVRPPELEIIVPTEGQTVISDLLEVKGITNREASVIVNNQPVIVSESGEFSAEIEVSEETEKIEIRSSSRTGKTTIKTVGIKVELGEKN